MRLTILLLLISISGFSQRGLGEYLANGYTAGYWRLNGNSNDLSSNANNGTDANITYGTAYGRFGSGGSFNGSSSKITISSNSSVKPASFTISAWIKPAATSDLCIFHLYHQYNPSGTYLIYGFNFHIISRHLSVVIGNGSYPANVYEITGTSTINTSTWYHVLATYDGTTARVYVNGVLEASGAATISYSSTNNVCMIGTYVYSSNANPPSIEVEKFNGSIDEVILESRAWTAQEIRNYYTQSKGRFVNN